jgi:mRNA interferase MazF
MKRGEIWWASLGGPVGSGPGYRRPVVVVQSNDFNDSRIRTAIVVAVTTNLELAAAPGNILLRRRDSGLRRDSVVNVSQVLTLDRALLTERVGGLAPRHVARLEAGLRLVLAL